MSTTAVIIVTHNSGSVLSSCLESLERQNKPPAQVCIVDSGSDDTAYLEEAEERFSASIFMQENIGFSRANNVGYAQLNAHVDTVLFLNPDVILDSSCIERAEGVFDSDRTVGLVTGRLAGYDFTVQQETGRLDSTGIFRKWYGRWYDRGQGEKTKGQYMKEENVPASCGALMFCRRNALDEAALSRNVVFDPDFFLYKEDIELCLRLRKSGWLIRYVPELSAMHGRGWNRQRRMMQRDLRLAASRSEVLLYRKHPSPYIIWALFKYVLVRVLNL